MNDLLKNGIIQSTIAALIVAFILWLIGAIYRKNDEAKIVKFLKESTQETTHRFRTTHAIASKINMSEEKVRKICGSSKKITRNEKEKESWRLTN